MKPISRFCLSNATKFIRISYCGLINVHIPQLDFIPTGFGVTFSPARYSSTPYVQIKTLSPIPVYPLGCRVHTHVRWKMVACQNVAPVQLRIYTNFGIIHDQEKRESLNYVVQMILGWMIFAIVVWLYLIPLFVFANTLTNVNTWRSRRYQNIKVWKNSTCWLILVVIVKLWFSVLLNLETLILNHPRVTNDVALSNLWMPIKCTVKISITP